MTGKFTAKSSEVKFDKETGEFLETNVSIKESTPKPEATLSERMTREIIREGKIERK